MTTPMHCPGMQDLKNLKSFVCKCPNCGKEKEVFSDEFNREHICAGCKKPIDFTSGIKFLEIDFVIRFEYEITTHPAEELTKLIYFCSDQGECALNELPP